METAYDWITLMLFAALVTHFLSDSVRPEPTEIPIGHYLMPAVGCAGANWLGNHGWNGAAIALIALTVGYAYRFLGPGRGGSSSHSE